MRDVDNKFATKHSWQHFHKATLHWKDGSRAATPLELKHLMLHGAIKAQAPKASMMLVAAAVDALTRLGVEGPILSVLEDIPRLKTHDTEPVVMPPIPVNPDIAGPSNASHAQEEELPVVLPKVVIAPKDKRAHYSLPKNLQDAEPLHGQMEAF